MHFPNAWCISLQLDQDICSAISLFYSAILNFKRLFDHKKRHTTGKTMMIIFCPGIQDSKTIDKICDLWIFLKTAWWNLNIQIWLVKIFWKYLQRRNCWPQCKKNLQVAILVCEWGIMWGKILVFFIPYMRFPLKSLEEMLQK